MSVPWIMTPVVLVVLFGGLTGCEKKEAAPSQPAKLKLAGIVFQDDHFFRLVQFGMRDAARKADVELLEANSNNRPEREIELVNTYVSRGVNAILISPLSKKGSVAALQLAKDKGIKIILHNTPIEGDLGETYIECDPKDLGIRTGKAARQYIQEKLGGKANVAVIAFKSQIAEQSDARTNGFKSQIEDLPGVRIVAEQDAWKAEDAVNKAGAILSAHPEINLVWSANEGGTIGSVLAVKNAGKAGQVVVFGTDCCDQLMEFLLSDDNILQAITSQRPFDVGRMAVESAVKVLKGQPVEKKVYMSGILLTRDDPAAVRAFQKQMKEWMSMGSP